MPYHAGSRRENAEIRPTPQRTDHDFEIQGREDQHHAGSSGSKPLSKDDAPQTEVETEEMRVTPFREAVGALMLAATMTRPDVAYAANQLGNLTTTQDQHTGGRRKGHYNTCGARRTLGSSTEERRGRAQNCRHGWTPISPLACPDTRRSFSGEVGMLGGARSVGS